MKITKIGHCCLVIKHKDLTILTDPGLFSSGQEEVTGVDLIIITHEHADHLHIESLQKVLKNNPEAKIISNSSVGKILDAEGIEHEIVEDGQDTNFNGVLIEAFGNDHAEIFEEFGLVQNTGYFIDNILFYPGDSFHNPGKKVDILAIPISAPWLAIREPIKYAREIKPRLCFPVHDAVLSEIGQGLHYKVFEANTKEDTKFVPLELGKETEF